MIPILFAANVTPDNSNGIGRLTDAISCVVEEVRNGSYELEMTYPVTGIHYNEITLWSQIRTTAFKGSGSQIFRVYRISKPINGVVTIYAHHISYDLKRIVVSPYTASSCAGALSSLKSSMMTSNPFTFWTNKTTTGNFKQAHPDTARNILGGHSGSILDTYGTGDYEFDNYAVKLWVSRGSDRGVTIRYGKNLTDLEVLLDSDNAYAAMVPYWVSQDGKTSVSGSRVQSAHMSDIPMDSTMAMDFSQEYEEAPTAAQLNERAAQYMARNAVWEIKQNLTVSFVALADTEEYKNVASLETVNLCDTVHIYHPDLGVSAAAKVIRTKWDSLRERYIEIELGNPKVSLYEAINPVTKADVVEQATQTSNFLLDSMAELIDALSGVDSGHVVFNRTADGHISEIYVMDTDDQATATDVLRINYMGIYASTNGINGTYNLAITTGGTINAAQILTGILSAIEINNGNGTFHVDSAGTLTARAGSVGGWNIDQFRLSRSYEYDDEDNHHHIVTAILQPPVAGTTSILTVTHQIDNNTPTVPFAITADGTARFNYMVGLTVGSPTLSSPSRLYGALTVDGSTTLSGQLIASGNTFVYAPLVIGKATDTKYVWHYGSEVKQGNLKLYGTLYLGAVVNDSRVQYGRIYMPTDHEMYLHIESDLNRSVKLAQDNGHWGLFPYGDTYLDLGLSNHRWDNVYAQNGTIQTSDKRQKKRIKALGHKALEFISKLRPVSFLMRKGTSGRRHYGLIAQEVEEAMKACGMTSADFAGLVKDEEGRYGLRYEEFIAPLILAVQDLTKRVEALEGKK